MDRVRVSVLLPRLDVTPYQSDGSRVNEWSMVNGQWHSKESDLVGLIVVSVVGSRVE